MLHSPTGTLVLLVGNFSSEQLTCKSFRPFRHVTQVEGHIVCFCQDIKVNVVEFEQILHHEWSQCCHLREP